MNIQKVIKILEKEPSFRLKQIKKAVFVDLIENWMQATTLPLDLRQELESISPIYELTLEKQLISKDKATSKVLLAAKDGSKTEAVLMRHGSIDTPLSGRSTVCISSQVGCSVGCEFCATGQLGLKRNLSDWEMTEQVLFFAQLLKKEGKRVDNVVFMGMGEPFLNYDNVLAAVKTINDQAGLNLGARHISISTCGVVEGIRKFTDEDLQVNMAISLHAARNTLRSKLVPLNQQYPVEAIVAAVDEYVKKTRRRVMFEYLMIAGINDGEKDAKDLARLLKRPLCFVNLISYNPIGHSDFKPSSEARIQKFREILKNYGITVTQRHEFGREIKGACGQLAGK
ncbi:MAG: 23S rRNA (adenine(2503)-C(2))-methyltransferase RlmN [Candidatus Nealsonbacteria bacterium]